MPAHSLVQSVIYPRNFLVDLLSAEPSSRHGVLEGYSRGGMTHIQEEGGLRRGNCCDTGRTGPGAEACWERAQCVCGQTGGPVIAAQRLQWGAFLVVTTTVRSQPLGRSTSFLVVSACSWGPWDPV